MKRDSAYWEDVLNAFYIAGNFGKFEEAYDAFVKAYPEFREFRSEYGTAHIRASFTKRLAARFREVDRKESDSQPTPPHLRQAFLPFAIDVPPLSSSVNAFDGQGRLSISDATVKQHRYHHRENKQYHHRGYVYRQAAEEKWVEFAEIIKQRFPDINHPENLPLAEIVRLLEQRKNEAAVDSHAQTPAPPL